MLTVWLCEKRMSSKQQWKVTYSNPHLVLFLRPCFEQPVLHDHLQTTSHISLLNLHWHRVRMPQYVHILVSTSSCPLRLVVESCILLRCWGDIILRTFYWAYSYIESFLVSYIAVALTFAGELWRNICLSQILHQWQTKEIIPSKSSLLN